MNRSLVIIGLYLVAMVCFAGQEQFVPLPVGFKTVPLTEKDTLFVKEKATFSWISDVEHVINSKDGTVYLADADEPYYICGDIVPGQTYFELFPYHYYDQAEVDKLGKKVNYKLIAKNITNSPVLLEIDGQGTTRDWDHYEAWEGALSGKSKRAIHIVPGKSVVLWEEKALEGDLPWSGIILGRCSGDIWVCDYVYAGDQDPGLKGEVQMPDISQPPYNWPSFTRGSSDWNSADIFMFKGSRTVGKRIDLGKIDKGVYAFAIADSPGGPENNPSDYAVIEGTFADDNMPVLDPVSGKSHLFFGGNYPVMYKVDLSFANTTDRDVEVKFMVCSNDKFNVDTIVGVWNDSKMQWRRVPVISKNSHWEVFAKVLKPGDMVDDELMLIPLGSRWGGMVCSLVVD